MSLTTPRGVLASMTSRHLALCALQFETTNDFHGNLAKLKALILKTPENSVAVAPEVCLSGFCYDRLDEASAFSRLATEELLLLSQNRTFALTMIEEQKGGIYNVAKVFSKGRIIHERAKVKLFKFGGEDRYFRAGNEDEVAIFEADGLKFALIVCFELRFIELWRRIQGADIILVPSMWGVARKSHFESLSSSLALLHQAFVIAANSANFDMAKGSAIVDPFGEAFRDDSRELLFVQADLSKIRKMRRYMDVGLNKEH